MRNFRAMRSIGQIHRNNWFGSVFVAGWIIGMFFMNFGKSVWLDRTGLLSKDYLSGFLNTPVYGNALFVFLLRKRLGMVFFLALLSTTYLGRWSSHAAAAGFGFSFGVFLAAATLRYGFLGIFLVVISLFPHYLIYAPLIYLLLLWCQSSYEECQRKAPVQIERVLSILLIGVFFLLGSLLEAYVNPAVLKAFLHQLVR